MSIRTEDSVLYMEIICIVTFIWCVPYKRFHCNIYFYLHIFPSRLLTLSTSQTEDKAIIIDLERKLKKEVEARNRVDAELREHRHAITNAFTQEELAGLRKKVQDQQHELTKLREHLKEQQQSWEHRHKREVYCSHVNLLEYYCCAIVGSIDYINPLTK